MSGLLIRIRRRTGLVLLAVACGLLAMDGARAAQSYTVSGVAVDVTAESAVAAREQALIQGQRKAFEQLVVELLGVGQAGAVRRPSDDELSAMVQDFEVENERASAVRYIGSLTFRFDAEAVDALIGRPPAGSAGTPAFPTTGPVRNLNVTVPIRNLAEWVEVRRRLSSVALVRRAEVRYLAREEARLNLVFSGAPEQLSQALAQRQLFLTEATPYWVLELAGGARSTSP
jgi:hypothetical protein